MSNGWNRLFLFGVVATAMALVADRAQGSVVLGERDFSASEFLGVDLSPRVANGQGGSGANSSPSRFSTALAIEMPSSGDFVDDPVHQVVHPLFLSSPAGMLPSSSSLSQVTGSGIGGATAENELEVPPADSLLATLSPESRTVLPTGPVFRWFRPPRSWL